MSNKKQVPARSGSGTRKEMRFPYRLCLAGGWLDQPWVSIVCPGPVVVAQILPSMDFNYRSGLATSSRECAIKLWGDRYPDGDPVENARLLFGAENPPGTSYVSGSQDHLGLMLPGINRLWYEGGYWPTAIDSRTDQSTCDWLSDVIWLVKMEPRPSGYDPLIEKHLDESFVKELAAASSLCWESILKKDIAGLGKSLTNTFLTWKKMLPNTVPEPVFREMKKFLSDYPGAITSGAGGGYAIVVSEKAVPGSVKIRIRY